jgi:type VI protein secretion system component Hcp
MTSLSPIIARSWQHNMRLKGTSVSTHKAESSGRLTANRRDVLRTATGLAAGAVVGSTLIDTQNSVNAQANPSKGNAQIIGQIGDRGQFRVLTFSWGLASSFADVGSGVGAAVEASTFDFTKNVDALTPGMQLSVAQGRHFQRAIITHTDTTGAPIFSYAFEDVILTSDQVSATADGSVPMENVTFRFEKVTMMHGDQGYVWDFSANTGNAIP